MIDNSQRNIKGRSRCYSIMEENATPKHVKEHVGLNKNAPIRRYMSFRNIQFQNALYPYF